MSSEGGTGRESDETTSFVLQPPNSASSRMAGAHPAPTQVVPPQSRPAQDPGTGRLIAGRYRLLAKLGLPTVVDVDFRPTDYDIQLPTD